jgi:hypothetical protein
MLDVTKFLRDTHIQSTSPAFWSFLSIWMNFIEGCVDAAYNDPMDSARETDIAAENIGALQQKSRILRHGSSTGGLSLSKRDRCGRLIGVSAQVQLRR